MANRNIEDEEFKFARRPRDIAPTRTITQYMISPEGAILNLFDIFYCVKIKYNFFSSREI